MTISGIMAPWGAPCWLGGTARTTSAVATTGLVGFGDQLSALPKQLFVKIARYVPAEPALTTEAAEEDEEVDGKDITHVERPGFRIRDGGGGKGGGAGGGGAAADAAGAGAK